MKTKPEQRKRIIQQRLKQGIHDSPAELASMFNVSLMTVHRDIKQIEQKNSNVQTQHPAPLPHNSIVKMQRNASAKSAIGQFVASNLIDSEADSIIIDSGTTTLALVSALQDAPINIMVNSLPALNILSEHKQSHAYTLSGRLNPNTMAFEGSIAFDMLENYHFTKAFLGTGGIDLKTGLTTTNTANAQLTRKMAQQAEQVYILADSSKFNHRALASVMGFEGITGIITERGVPNEYKSVFDKHGIQLFEVGT